MVRRAAARRASESAGGATKWDKAGWGKDKYGKGKDKYGKGKDPPVMKGIFYDVKTWRNETGLHQHEVIAPRNSCCCSAVLTS